MHKNKLTALDKCIVLLSYVNDRNPGLFIQIIESVPKHHSQEILTRLKERPLYGKDEVQDVLEEFNDLEDRIAQLEAVPQKGIWEGDYVIGSLADLEALIGYSSIAGNLFIHEDA